MQDSKSPNKIPPKPTNVHYFTLESSSSLAPSTHSSPSTTSSSDQAHESPTNSSDSPNLKLENFHSPKDLKQTLLACASAVEANDTLTAEHLIAESRQLVSVSGEPIQRLGAYLLEGLVARLSSSGSSIYKALLFKESYIHILHEICPYFKFAYMAANGAIADAVKNEQRIHIIDFQMSQGNQWATLIQALAMRPGGPPSLTITTIDDQIIDPPRFHTIQQQLTALAESCNLNFQFRREFKIQNVKISPEETVAVNFVYELHHVADESVDTWNHRDRVLRAVKSLGPKIVTLVERESNANTAAFLPRFAEVLDYYAAVFDSIDWCLARESRERICVEQKCLAREIVNVVACEGGERVERCEVHGKWKARFGMAGFAGRPLSGVVNCVIRGLLEGYCGRFRVAERVGPIFRGWGERDLVVTSAWR